jgi:hypothetical protein
VSSERGEGFHGSKGWERAGVDRINEHVGLCCTSGVAGPRSGRRVGEPYFVVLRDIQMPFQGIGKRSVLVVEVTEIGTVDWEAGENASRDRR